MQKWEEAERDHLSGMKYKEIAAKYGVTVSAVKSWKARKWSKEKVATNTKKVAHDLDVTELDKSGLTDKQKLFAIKYVKSFNATQAYMTAYDVGYETANKLAPRMMVNDGVKKEIEKLRKQALARSSIEVSQVLADISKEATADIGDYMNFGGHDEYLTDYDGDIQEDMNGNPIILHRSYAQLKDKDKVDTSLIKKVTVGKDGPVIELHDKQKAREQLLKFMQADSTNRKLKAEIDVLEAKVKALSGTDDTVETTTIVDDMEAIPDE